VVAATVVLATVGCGENSGAIDTDATRDVVATEVAEPTIFLVDAAGETSRLLRLDPPGWTIVEVTDLPDGARGLTLDRDGERLIWASRDDNVIQSGTRDGEGIETLSLAGHDSAYAVAVGAESGDLFWTDYGRDQILRWDGASASPLILVSGLESPRAVAVDERSGWVYWVDRGAGRVSRAPASGGAVEDLVVEGLSAPYGLALDPIDGSLLVADADLGSIFRWDPVAAVLGTWLADAGTHPSFVVVDEATGWVYWTDNRDNVVRRRQRSGGPVEVIAEGLAGPRGFVLVR
jgi:sugar lactone lactonase YvrE